MSNRNLAAAAPPICGVRPSRSLAGWLARPLGAGIMEFLRSAPGRVAAWRQYRREREELHAFLASDHRIAADIGYRHHRE